MPQGHTTQPNADARPIAAITGASAGIGAEFARQLAAGGYDLILIARREDRLRELAETLPTQADVLPADLTDEADLERVCEHLVACDRLAMLVNNAGFGTRPLYHETPEADLDAMAKLHVVATVRLTRAALPGMVARNRGAIVNVSSVAGFFQSPSNVLYCSTKAWMNSFTDGLCIELADTKVRAMALCPGFTYSEFHDVMGVERDAVPKKLWLSAEFVVRTALRDLARGKRLSIPSWRYRLIVTLSRLLPRAVRVHHARKRHTRLREQGIRSQM